MDKIRGARVNDALSLALHGALTGFECGCVAASQTLYVSLRLTGTASPYPEQRISAHSGMASRAGEGGMDRPGGGLTGPGACAGAHGDTGLEVNAHPPQQAPVLLQSAVDVCALSFVGSVGFPHPQLAPFPPGAASRPPPFAVSLVGGFCPTRPKTSLSQTGITGKSGRKAHSEGVNR